MISGDEIRRTIATLEDLISQASQASFKEVYPNLKKHLLNARTVAKNPELTGNETIDFLIETMFLDDENKMKTHLEAEHGLSNNPKKDLLWEQAWQDSHSEGMQAVYEKYLDLMPLIK